MPTTKIGSRWNRGDYEGSLDFFRRDTRESVLTITPWGIIPVTNPYGAKDYYVDLNKTSASSLSAMAARDLTVDGLSWGTAFQTLAAAITASNTSIGLTANRWWARRNRIFVCGDGISEDLTVLPEKTDIIGVGADLYPFPRIIGHHIIGAAAVGCRFINMGFINDAADDLFVIPAGCHGLQFLGGLMLPKLGGSTKAIELTDTAAVIIDGVHIGWNAGGAIFAEGITVEGTVGHEIAIQNCRIYATEGIHAAALNITRGSIIRDNTIYATALTINDESLLFQVVNNNLISAAAAGDAAGVGAVSCNVKLAANNFVACDDANGIFPANNAFA